MAFWEIFCHNGEYPVGLTGMWVAISPTVRIGCDRVHHLGKFNNPDWFMCQVSRQNERDTVTRSLARK